MKVYGPYVRKDGRKHVVLIDGKKRRTVSYPKYLMEQSLGRRLSLDETVDHINRDFTDDRLENLRVVPRNRHMADDAKRVFPVEIICVLCGTRAVKRGADLDHNERMGKSGPFCSRNCAGRYSHKMQSGEALKERVSYRGQRRYFYADKIMPE